VAAPDTSSWPRRRPARTGALHLLPTATAGRERKRRESEINEGERSIEMKERGDTRRESETYEGEYKTSNDQIE
jgi:hypothetical protein